MIVVVFVIILVILVMLTSFNIIKKPEHFEEYFDDSDPVCSVPTQVCYHYNPQMGCLDAQRQASECDKPMSWQAKCAGECKDKSKVLACMMSKSVDVCL